MTSSISTQMLQIPESSVTQAEKIEKYNEILQQIHDQGDELAELEAFLQACLDEVVGVTISRQVLSRLIQTFDRIESSDTKKRVGSLALELVQPRVISFEEQDATLRLRLADLLESEDDCEGAAKVLVAIQLDSSQRKIADRDKLEIWIRITRNFLEDDDTISAETYLNRAKSVIHQVDDQTLNLHFQLCQARILDAQRQFLQACTQYHNLSHIPVIDAAERSRCLSAAITCAVLAPAGPMRSRALARLYKDERAAELEADYSILEKMFLQRVIAADEVTKFASRLAPHHKAQAANGTTVLSKAIIEHNLLGVSRLYCNISFDQLGKLVGLSAEDVEGYTARMIEQGRLVGRINQIDGRVHFGRLDSTADQLKASRFGLIGKEVRRWDDGIECLMEELERISSVIQAKHPRFCQEVMISEAEQMVRDR